jgi:hypothetical protein
MSILVKRRKMGGNGIRNWEGEKGKDSATDSHRHENGILKHSETKVGDEI